MYRKILHCDMNNFFASIELLTRPNLRGQALVVCGDQAERKGIVLAKSEVAKKMGVKTGDTILEAQRKCAYKLHIVKAHFDKYLYFSHLAQRIYNDYTDKVESFGLDECWLDLTHVKKDQGDEMFIACEIKERILKELGLSISVGLSFNKIFAKLASDLAAVNTFLEIQPANWQAQVWPLPIDALLGVGRAGSKFFKARKILTIGDLAVLPKHYVESALGINGLKLWYYANGLDMSPVRFSSEVAAVKSIGAGSTFPQDILTYQELEGVTMSLAQQVADRLKRYAYLAKLIQLEIKYCDFTQVQKQVVLPYASNATTYITGRATALLKETRALVKPVRALTFRVGKLEMLNSLQQLSYFNDYFLHDRESALDDTLYRLRQVYGNRSIRYGLQMEADKLLGTKQQELHAKNFKPLQAYS